MKSSNGYKDLLIASLLLMLIILFFIWRPLVSLYQTSDPINYGNNISTTVEYLKYDGDLYKEYLRAGEHSGIPQELDRKVENNMLAEKIDYTIYLLGTYLTIFIIYRYQNSDKSAVANGMLDRIIIRFQCMNAGIKRLLVVLYAIWWGTWFLRDEPMNGFSFIFMLFAYWILVSILIWIYDGFNKVNINKPLS